MARCCVSTRISRPPVVVDRYESLDAIVEAASANPDKRILVDLAAQTHEALVKWMDESGVKGLGLLDRQRVKIWLRNAYEQIDSAMI